jgi:hypothetical protein
VVKYWYGISARLWQVQNTGLGEGATMLSETIETRAHTTHDGILHLSVDVGVADIDVAVTVQVRPIGTEDVDANGWPKGFFGRVAGSMPELQRAPQGDFEQRTPLE